MRAIWTGIRILALTAASSPAFAQAGAPIPEPGVLELAGLGAAVAIALAWSKRRRK